MSLGQTKQASLSCTLNPRELWYAPDRRLRGKAASSQALEVIQWIRAGSDKKTEPGEVSLFIALHTCAYRAARRNGHKQIPEDERRIWASRWLTIRGYLVAKNTGLAHAVIGRFSNQNVDPDDLLSDALFALTRAVDKFNPWKGFRFSTYAYNAILRSLIRRAKLESKYRQIFHAPYSAALDVAEGSSDIQAQVYVERLKRILDRNLGKLTNLETHVLSQRFGANPKSQPSLQEVGENIGLSKERVRQIQITAIRKLREAMDEDPILQ